MWYLKPRIIIRSLLKDNSGASALETALIMVFGALFIISGLLVLSPGLKSP